MKINKLFIIILIWCIFFGGTMNKKRLKIIDKQIGDKITSSNSYSEVDPRFIDEEIYTIDIFDNQKNLITSLTTKYKKDWLKLKKYAEQKIKNNKKSEV